MRLKFLLARAGIVLATSLALPTLAADKPNILVIWGDDIGPYNISAYNMGRMGYETPNIGKTNYANKCVTNLFFLHFQYLDQGLDLKKHMLFFACMHFFKDFCVLKSDFFLVFILRTRKNRF